MTPISVFGFIAVFTSIFLHCDANGNRRWEYINLPKEQVGAAYADEVEDSGNPSNEIHFNPFEYDDDYPFENILDGVERTPETQTNSFLTAKSSNDNKPPSWWFNNDEDAITSRNILSNIMNLERMTQNDPIFDESKVFNPKKDRNVSMKKLKVYWSFNQGINTPTRVVGFNRRRLQNMPIGRCLRSTWFREGLRRKQNKKNFSTNVSNRNFLWLGKPGKPLVLVRSEKDASLRAHPNLFNNRIWISKENGVTTNNPLVLLQPLNDLFPYQGYEKYDGPLINPYSPISDGKFKVYKWPSGRIRSTWLAQRGGNTPLSRLSTETIPEGLIPAYQSFLAAQENPSDLIGKIAPNLFLEQLIRSKKNMNLGDRLHSTWLRFSSAEEEDATVKTPNLFAGHTRDRRRMIDRKKDVKNRLKSIWLASPSNSDVFRKQMRLDLIRPNRIIYF